jgi:hypothetical protein
MVRDTRAKKKGEEKRFETLSFTKTKETDCFRRFTAASKRAQHDRARVVVQTRTFRFHVM